MCSPSNKIHREVGRAKDLSAPHYSFYSQRSTDSETPHYSARRRTGQASGVCSFLHVISSKKRLMKL